MGGDRHHTGQGPVRPSFRTTILSSRPLYPNIGVIYFAGAPNNVTTTTFSITPLISRRSVVPRVPVRVRVESTRKTVLVGPIGGGGHAIEETTIFSMNSTGFHPIDKASFRKLPAILLLPTIGTQGVYHLFHRTRSFFPQHNRRHFVDNVSHVRSYSSGNGRGGGGRCFCCFGRGARSGLLVSICFVFRVSVCSGTHHGRHGDNEPRGNHVTTCRNGHSTTCETYRITRRGCT